LRPKQHVLDDRVPAILLTLKQPTFVTIDEDFWDRRCCHPDYAVLYFALRIGEQPQLPNLLRELFRQPGFRKRTERMGKVVRVTAKGIEYWKFPRHELQRVMWQPKRRRTR
jgi:hypothetical protein